MDVIELSEEEDKPEEYLEGLQFVVSGVFNNITRDSLEKFILDHGGRRTGSVSGKVDYLVVGHKLEDGRDVSEGGKYLAAKKKSVAIIDETSFEQLVQQRSGNNDFSFGLSRPSVIPVAVKPPVKSPAKAEQKKTIAPQVPQPEQKEEATNFVREKEMWTEKYKPLRVEDLIGNRGAIDNLYTWLKDWDEVVLRGYKKKIEFRGGNFGDAPNLNARAVLIAGPPGIGKTSSARIVCAQLGYEVIEMNASDTRNKAAIEMRVKDLSSNKSLDYFSTAGLKRADENTNALASAIGGIAT